MLADISPSFGYFVRWLALTLFGPAQLGDREDPVERLRRRYGRSAHVAHAHPLGLQRSYENLPD